MKNPITLINDIVAQIELSDRYQTTAETSENVDAYLARYKGSYIDMHIVADRLSTIASQIMDDVKERAYEEAMLEGYEAEFTYKGNALTPVESHKKYEFPDDEYIAKVQEDLKPITKKLKDIKKTEKGLKDSIKAREQELIEEGRAKFITSNRYLKISKK